MKRKAPPRASAAAAQAAPAPADCYTIDHIPNHDSMQRAHRTGHHDGMEASRLGHPPITGQARSAPPRGTRAQQRWVTEQGPGATLHATARSSIGKTRPCRGSVLARILRGHSAGLACQPGASHAEATRAPTAAQPIIDHTRHHMQYWATVQRLWRRNIHRSVSPRPTPSDPDTPGPIDVAST